MFKVQQGSMETGEGTVDLRIGCLFMNLVSLLMQKQTFYLVRQQLTKCLSNVELGGPQDITSFFDRNCSTSVPKQLCWCSLRTKVF